MTSKRGFTDENSLYRIPPYYYLHVLDQNTNVSRIEIGPKTFIRADNERVVLGPERMITIPPRHYCLVENPVVRGTDGNVVTDTAGQIKLSHADQEIRLNQDPFPLYPGEIVKIAVTALTTVVSNSALRLRAILDFKDENGVTRIAGDEYLFKGPGTYIPRKEVEVDETIRATVVKPNQALKLRARKECEDHEGNARVTGEVWLVKETGAYLPGAFEEVLDIVDACVLTEKSALHVEATRTFKDDFGIIRKNGEEWLIKMCDTETHIPHVYEKVIGFVKITTLTNRQYCVILNPVDEKNKPQLGRKKLVKGEKSFFLMPGEVLEKGVQNVYVLGENEGLILKSNEEFKDGDAVRKPGDRWMIQGPIEYIPPVEVEVSTKRTAIPLDDNEGIYVRNIKSGNVRAISGKTYLLTQDEELWEKSLPKAIEALLVGERDPLADRSDRSKPVEAKPRDKTKVITFRVPHNAVVQIYDYKEKKARIVFGPELVMLDPEEQFTQLSLSGGKPKKPNVIKSLCLLLGPDFCTDIIVVETADHARLQLQLSYNWHFQADKNSKEDAQKIFSVPDFIGDSCKAMASRIRGAVASVQFDDFHKNSARIIRGSVFGYTEQNKIGDTFVFKQNNLTITSIDIQGVEPVDQRTREALQKSVQLAIEITTAAQEASARQEAERLEQEAKGRLERQKIHDESEIEKARKDLLELQAQSAAVEARGQARADAESRAESVCIEAQANVDQSSLKAKALKIEADAELDRLTQALQYTKDANHVEIEKAKELADIEVGKFQQMITAIGADTIKSIALAGPEMQVKLLKSLGIQSTLITDGNSPINLFNTANGLIGANVPGNAMGGVGATNQYRPTASMNGEE